MKGSTLSKLVDLMTPFLEKAVTTFRRPIPVHTQVAISVWRLATGECYRSISSHFSVGKSTAVKIVREFCECLVLLSDLFISFPHGDVEVGEAMEKFKRSYDCPIPQILGAVDGTHIPIIGPNVPSCNDYFSR